MTKRDDAAGTPEPGTGATPEPQQVPGTPCPCGHAHELDPAIARMIAAHGPAAVMHGPGGSWHVPRVYAAAHDVTAAALPEAAQAYGFEPA